MLRFNVQYLELVSSSGPCTLRKIKIMLCTEILKRSWKQLLSPSLRKIVQHTTIFKMDQKWMVISVNATFKSKWNVVVLRHRIGRIFTPVNRIEKCPLSLVLATSVYRENPNKMATSRSGVPDDVTTRPWITLSGHLHRQRTVSSWPRGQLLLHSKKNRENLLYG